ncbi:MAG: hypothetical protein Q7K42_02195 [Candidatus Diapherotrites archaeon]|nr:hypothetical protein [Candidatus Diapherotrites archaeon]
MARRPNRPLKKLVRAEIIARRKAAEEQADARIKEIRERHAGSLGTDVKVNVPINVDIRAQPKVKISYDHEEVEHEGEDSFEVDAGGEHNSDFGEGSGRRRERNYRDNRRSTEDLKRMETIAINAKMRDIKIPAWEFQGKKFAVDDNTIESVKQQIWELDRIAEHGHQMQFYTPGHHSGFLDKVDWFINNILLFEKITGKAWHMKGKSTGIEVSRDPAFGIAHSIFGEQRGVMHVGDKQRAGAKKLANSLKASLYHMEAYKKKHEELSETWSAHGVRGDWNRAIKLSDKFHRFMTQMEQVKDSELGKAFSIIPPEPKEKRAEPSEENLEHLRQEYSSLMQRYKFTDKNVRRRALPQRQRDN